jgi:hypothetical protein
VNGWLIFNSWLCNIAKRVVFSCRRERASECEKPVIAK